MKIAFLNITQGKVNRGAETFVAELASRLSQNNDVEIISENQQMLPRWPILWRFFIDPNGLQILWFTLKNTFKLIKEKYDVVIPVNGGWQAGLVRLITWVYGGKMVISGQSGIGWDDKNNLYSFPDCFVPISKKAQKWAQKTNPFLKNIHYIPNGVDLNKFTPEGDILETNLSSPVVLTVAALVPSKRIDLVIKAVSRLDNVSLLIVGDGPLKKELSCMGNKILGNRFELKSVEYKNMSKVYRAADVFVFTPQKSEAFGIVLTEALAANLPVITINDKTRQDIVGKAGYFIKSPNKSKKLAKQIKKALNHAWNDKPRRQAENFSWDKITKEYEKLFKKLI